MESTATILRTLRWYLGRHDVDADGIRVLTGHPLALIGGTWDDLSGFASLLAPERAVLDLRRRTPSSREVHELPHTCPDVIVLADRAERVVASLGVTLQPWHMAVSPLSARPHQAVPLLREAILDLGITEPIDDTALEMLHSVALYRWPRGLHELRDVARRIAALLEGGSHAGAAKRLSVTRQAISKYLNRRSA